MQTRTEPRRSADKHGVQSLSGSTALLTEVDAVSIAVPTSAHHRRRENCVWARKCMCWWKNRLPSRSPKPMTSSSWPAGTIASCKSDTASDSIPQSGPCARRFMRPGFIECHRLSPYGERGTDVDVVLDLMIHDLDLVLSFNPGPVEEVRAAGVPVLSANDRYCQCANCRSPADAWPISRPAESRQRGCGNFVLFQRDGYLSVDFQTRQAAILRRQVGANQRPEIFMEPAQTDR